ncbi:pleiotropic drug resistance protein ABC superfamily [Phytophthora sojae]|uniref:Pleiotropic drug resistance protein ABC superfamily n=1 Tax=Phytophthora sojae (strain P6497) TaxID=1094619 RepID=G4Z989_PHYSP|nr:pleiotropic drug resistance protein ABC superfamily [Phytophthora sojae]EGZ21143.1 pleiotropic drug resistance protein ABC superfamily [Phytophthora sojae]|eukprot:XP_009523860.1 pleiotropic drug resistance protein ABC superfamily [Phytophthora sojae]
MVSSTPSTGSEQQEILYDNGATLMASGALALHDHVASRMQAALGRRLPQVEVRYKDVSISANIVVKDAAQVEAELPTIANVIKQSARSVGGKRHVVQKSILRNVSGVFKPGTMTLVLGQPGSGKSSLMKLLSGRFPTSRNVSIEGDVAFNGSSPSTDFDGQETLEFAHGCNGGGLSKRDQQRLVHGSPEENQAALEAARALYKHHPDVIIRLLGLENCQNTIVGDAMLRGVSGGERKRVTTGEMAFGNKFVLLMNEISTGLDSAATFDIISTQRSLAKAFGKTVVISLLQPSPEVFELFDDVLLLNDGYVMYHGPRSEAQNYFEDVGFKCPPSRDVADFLLDLGTDKQRQYEVGPIPRTAAQFADEFETSDTHKRMMNHLHSPVDQELLEDGKTYIDSTPQFQQGFFTGTATIVARELKVLAQDSAAVKSRAFMALVLGLLYGTAFYQFDEVNSQVVMGLAYSAVDTLSVAKSAMIPTILATRDVIYKQRGANFYRTSSFVIASSAKQIPVVLMETLLFGSIVYWMCGFVASAQSFVLYQVVLFLVNMAYAAWFFFIASVCPNINVANPISLLSLLFLATFSGFLITKESIPVYLSWIYYISPHAWGIHAVAVNQYRDSRFDTCVYVGVDYCAEYGMQMGEYMLSVYGVPSEKYWLWVSLRDNYALVTTPKAATNALNNEQDVILSVTRSTEKNFVPVTLAFNDLWYSVPDPTNAKSSIDLLNGVSGFALPGTITALMGSSGAGKMTLMEVIAGRKTGGTIRGDIMLNGYPATDLAIRRATGYCEQMDIHSDASTFREALMFSAFLRQGADVPDSQKYDSVNECLELLDLHPIADQIIRGSSTEQMKRLTIGVELAAQPSVLFLDEPTSGLDARSAKLIMDGVRKVADTGRTVVCTIHQPSAVMFEVFDSLLLLKRGGEMVFFGDLGAKATKLVEYFESIDGVAKLEKDYNPATWMLEVIGAGVGNDNGNKTDFVHIFKSSVQAQQLEANLKREGVTRPSPNVPALVFGKKRAAGNLTQAKFLIKRFFDLSVVPISIQERASFYRERSCESYNAFWYFVGATLVEIPYCFFESLLFMVIYYPMVGFTGDTQFFAYWLNLTGLVVLQAYFGQLLAYLAPNLEVASVFVILVNYVWITFTGFNPPVASIPQDYR